MRSQAAKEGHEVAQLLEGKVSRKVKINVWCCYVNSV